MSGHNAARRSLDAAHNGAGYAPIRHSALDPTGRPVRSTAESDDAVASYHQAHAPRAEGTVWSHEPGGIVYPASAAERTGNAVEAKIADPLASPRKGRVQASDGSVQRIPALEQGFVSEFQDARAADSNSYSVKVAYGRSALADGSNTGQPTWTAENVRRSTPDFLGSALANGEMHKLNPHTQELRPGSTPFNHTRIDQLDLTSKPRQYFGYTYGSNDKQQLMRHNEAEVRD